MSRYHELASKVVEEHKKVLLDVDEKEVEKLLDAIVEAKCIQVFGMGRMKCAVRAFVMRLMHMGLNAHVVYDTTCPNIGPGDLLIVNCACTAIGYRHNGETSRPGTPRQGRGDSIHPADGGALRADHFRFRGYSHNAPDGKAQDHRRADGKEAHESRRLYGFQHRVLIDG